MTTTSELQLMPRMRWKRLTRLFGGTVAVGAMLMAAACAGTPAEEPAQGESSSGITEINVTEQPDRVNGQPGIAVNPNDPDNIVYIGTNHIPDEDDDITGREFIGGTISEFQCYSAFSTDRGETWTETTFPQGDRPFCGDPYLAVDPDGVFYTAFNRLGCPNSPGAALSDPCDQGAGRVGVARSDDGGKTWSEPVDTTVFRATTPRLRIDVETGKIYVAGGIEGPSPHAISVSGDGGLTWSDQAPLPSQPFGNQIAVHDGVLATATALGVTDDLVGATEVLFYVSTDDGATYATHPVTDSSGEPAMVPRGVSLPDNVQLTSSDPVPWVTADPTATGRFAIMVPHGEAFAVYVTDDSGETWTDPTIIPADGARKPWIEYGPDGELGVVWRTLGGDIVNAFAVISLDGGATFSPALRVNSEAQRWGFGISGGDEWSRILFDGDDVFVSWADGRTGGSLDGVLARVPVSLFED